MSSSEGYLSAWSEEAIYTWRAMSPVVVHRGGRKTFCHHSTMYHTCVCQTENLN